MSAQPLQPTTESPTLIHLADLAKEPFRIFFPAGVIAGIVGVLLWPLYFGGVIEFYPSTTHPRIMTFGLFGGFILGFLGTAMPRMLSARPLHLLEAFVLLALFAAMVFAFAAGKLFAGDVLFLALLLSFVTSLAFRLGKRKDTPPPGFVLIGLAFISVAVGTILGITKNDGEEDVIWIMLQRLLCYQGFVLLPILGIGPFILPRFFGMPNAHDFPEAMVPSQAWVKKAALALTAGLLILGSFALEVFGWPRTGHGLRFVTTLVYLYLEMPFHRAPKVGSALGLSIRVAFLCVLAGFFTIWIFPAYRISLLHLTLIGGFAVLMFVVATRVVFGHSGNLDRLKGRNRWLPISIGMMLFAMATRMSGDFWPKVMISHYNYGAILWVLGVILWSVYVLPKVMVADAEN